MKSSRSMKWGILILAFVLCLPTLALAQGGTGGSGGGGSVNNRGGNASFRANNPVPVLIYTVWGLGDGSGSGSGSGGSGSGGSSLTADSPVSTLVIYDNGLATWNRSNATGSGGSGCSGNCVDTVQISNSDVNGFIRGLRQAGAFRRNSNNGTAQEGDTAMVTITVFNPVQGTSTVSVARTITFYTGDDGATTQGSSQFTGVQNSFNNFFNTNFGGNDSGSGSGGGSGSGSGGGS
jgi:hypothetical protein